MNEFKQRQLEEFDDIVRPVMKWLGEVGHPHMKIVIDNQIAELVEGITSACVKTSESCEEPQPPAIREGVWRTRGGKVCGVYLRDDLPEGATQSYRNAGVYVWYCRHSAGWWTVATDGMHWSGDHPQTACDLTEFICPLPPDRRMTILNPKEGDKLPENGEVWCWDVACGWTPLSSDCYAYKAFIYAHLPEKFCNAAEPSRTEEVRSSSSATSGGEAPWVPKAGEWVVVTNKGSSASEVGDIARVDELSETNNCWRLGRICTWHNCDTSRPATPEEIAIAEKREQITSEPCEGCQRPEIHKMCPAWRTPFYMSGIAFTPEIEARWKRLPPIDKGWVWVVDRTEKPHSMARLVEGLHDSGFTGWQDGRAGSPAEPYDQGEDCEYIKPAEEQPEPELYFTYLATP